MPSHLSGGTMQRLTDIREQFPVEVVLWLRTLSNTRDRKSHWKGGEEEKTEEKMGGRERFQGQQGLHGAACRHPSYGHMSNSPLSTSKMTKHIPPCFSITDPTWYSQWLVWFQHIPFHSSPKRPWLVPEVLQKTVTHTRTHTHSLCSRSDIRG